VVYLGCANKQKHNSPAMVFFGKILTSTAFVLTIGALVGTGLLWWGGGVGDEWFGIGIVYG
jgi:hypothetical protein